MDIFNNFDVDNDLEIDCDKKKKDLEVSRNL